MLHRLDRRDFVKGIALGTAAMAMPCEAADADRPNVLFLMTDQQTLRAMSAYGNRHLHTPHMDSIAAAGVRFENSYCTSPVCGPSRSSLITGRMPHETGVNVNGQTPDPAMPNMGHIFRRAGYETAWAGKWHLPASYPRGGKAAIPGFEYLPIERPTGLGGQTDEPVADEAIKFLRRKHERPFLLSVSLHNPHDICAWTGRKPIDRPPIDQCPPLPDNFEVDPREPEFIQDCRRRTYYGPENQHTKNWDRDQWRRYLYAHYRFTEQVDKTIGRVLATLRQQGLAQNTLIVLTSDHGEGSAGHQWVVKLMLYEEPVTVPLVVSFPGHTPTGAVDRDHLVSGIDVVPTLCDYADVRPPENLTGTSLRPWIEDPKSPGREFVVSELQPFPKQPDRRGRMVRTDRYKYVAFSDGRDPEMLFDLKADPGETRNLARDTAMQAELKRHRDLLADWIKSTKDDFRVPR